MRSVAVGGPFAPAMGRALPIWRRWLCSYPPHVLPVTRYNRRFRHISAYQSENSSTANSSIHIALSPYMPRRCLRRVFSRTRCLTSATRLAVSYILYTGKKITYIGTKNRKNSPKTQNFSKKFESRQKQLSGRECSVIPSATSGKRTAFPPPPAAPAGRKRRAAPRRRGQ